MGGRAMLKDPMKTYRWRLVIDGVVRSTWASVTGLESNVEVVPYAEGGSDTNQKSPGRKEYPNLVLKTGLFAPGVPGSDDIFDLAVGVHELGNVGASREFRFACTLELYGNNNQLAYSYEIVNGWVAKWVPVPELGTDSGVAMETAEIAHEGWRRTYPT